MSSSIGGVTRAAGEAGSAAGQVLLHADELGAQSNRLRSNVETFLGEIRAA
jgi:methyl-accepting chemotaxis protein